MANALTINTDLVIDYLLANASSVSGVTAADLISMVGLSKSTVHRVISRCPAIKQNAVAGKAIPTYYVDHEELASWRSSNPKRGYKRLTVNVAEVNAKRFLNQPAKVIFGDHLVPPLSSANDTPLRKELITLTTTYTKALKFQMGEEGLSHDEIAAARKAVDTLRDYGYKLLVYTESIKRKRAYLDDENFWKIWPLDKEAEHEQA